VSTTVNRERLEELVGRERQTFASRHPESQKLFFDGSDVLLRGVPMSWMSEWAGGFPIFFDRAVGSSLTDIDGNTYTDFCLGDTGAMAGHAPAAVADAVDRRYRMGSTTMLPTADAAWVAAELGRRFGLEVWQFSLTATDANRWALRLARELTGRPYVLVFNHCYHGTVDEAGAMLGDDGSVIRRDGNVGPSVDPRLTTKVIEFNDVNALRGALDPRDVACVLTEPALTNVGIVLPEPGFHDALRQITTETDTLLVVDETQTQAAGPGGFTAAHKLRPDVLTIGKAIAGGIPIGAFGMTRDLTNRINGAALDLADEGAVGGTLAGNALSMAAARATLELVLTEEAFARMDSLAETLAMGIREVIDSHGLPWHVARVGARTEYRYCPTPPRTGAESAAAADEILDSYLHCFLLNRGVLTTPFHNMALISPATAPTDIGAYLSTFASAIDDVLSPSA
jgi:glutamate-1-semialdehyde 2,1-aminomutase